MDKVKEIEETKLLLPSEFSYIYDKVTWYRRCSSGRCDEKGLKAFLAKFYLRPLCSQLNITVGRFLFIFE